MENYSLDELDKSILESLRADPLETNKALAEKLSITEVTIAARIRSMEVNNVMKVMAQSDFRTQGYDVLANVDVNVSGRDVHSVAEEIAKIEGIGNLTIFMGDPSLMLLAMAATLPDLQKLIMEKIAKVEGVRSVETMVFTDVVKYQSEYANLRQGAQA